jgi:hypothetical protein
MAVTFAASKETRRHPIQAIRGNGWMVFKQPEIDTWRQADGEDQARDSAKNIFACYGIPGAGKSVMR